MKTSRRFCPWCFEPVGGGSCPACGNRGVGIDEVDPSRAHPQTGRVLDDRYRVLRFVGESVQGHEYVGFDAILGRKVALLFLDDQGGRDVETYQRFRQRAEVLAQLRSPNTVAFLDFEGMSSGTPYLVTESLEGRTLEQRLSVDEPLPLGDVGPVFAQVCGSLSEAHGLGIVHGDVRPGNILIWQHGMASQTAKLKGFYGCGGPVTSHGVRFGRPSAGCLTIPAEYLSPARIRGNPPVPADDLYSLGVTLYESLCGRPPFVGLREDVLRMHLEGAPPALPNAHRLPEGLVRLIFALLDKDQWVRPGSAAEVAEWLAGACKAR